MKNKFELPIVAALLSFTSGNVDAYSFLEHGGVFAGLQTGNLILLGIHISQWNLYSVMKIIVSIIIFSLGITVTTIIQDKYKVENKRKHLILKYEIGLVILTAILSGLIPNIFIVGLLAAISSAQLQEFTLIRGNKYNPVMMTMNLRRIIASSYNCFYKGDKQLKTQILDTLLVIVSFVAGSLSVGVLSIYLNIHSILLALLPLITVIVIANDNFNLGLVSKRNYD